MRGDSLTLSLGLGPRRLSRSRSDAALVRRAAAGDETAVRELFTRHWRGAHRAAWFVLRDEREAEDVAQEAFLAALRNLDGFDRRRPFAPWLHRIAVNRAIDCARARAARPLPTDVVASEAAAAGEGGADPELVAALGALDPEQRAVVVLRHVFGYRPSEVATMLALPVGTVNSRMRRALDGIARQLSERS